jgi:hypothetical protein
MSKREVAQVSCREVPRRSAQPRILSTTLQALTSWSSISLRCTFYHQDNVSLWCCSSHQRLQNIARSRSTLRKTTSRISHTGSCVGLHAHQYPLEERDTYRLQSKIRRTKGYPQWIMSTFPQRLTLLCTNHLIRPGRQYALYGFHQSCLTTDVSSAQ